MRNRPWLYKIRKKEGVLYMEGVLERRDSGFGIRDWG